MYGSFRSYEEFMQKIAETRILPRLPEECFLAELVASCCCSERDLRPPMWDVKEMLDSDEFHVAAQWTLPGAQPGLPPDLEGLNNSSRKDTSHATHCERGARM